MIFSWHISVILLNTYLEWNVVDFHLFLSEFSIKYVSKVTSGIDGISKLRHISACFYLIEDRLPTDLQQTKHSVCCCSYEDKSQLFVWSDLQHWFAKK